ncbi:CotH kinase family protein [Flavobacterium sp.]|uniref:CotH kinase family protein n=1 Tax=Flavobacterium sp. TaxID=239 RepID=UPI0038D24FA7
MKNAHKINLVLCLLLFVNFSFSQVFTDSNLPIVIITTDINPSTNLPYEIVDSPDVLATMKIIKHNDGTRNYVSDQSTSSLLNYNGRIGIQIRGSSSQAAPKKAYKVTTLMADNISNNNVSILGMPSENDWILNGLAFDPSLIRDYLAYNTSRKMGNYASRTQYCEVMINGEYMGLYLFQEKVKADSNRVNIVKITNTDIAGDNLTGGYITKADKTTGGDPIAWSTPSYTGVMVDYIHELPDPLAVNLVQNSYIYNHFNDFQSAISSNNTSLSNGYPVFIDVPSFIDFMLSNEFAANVDGYQFSTYFHKDRNGKLRAGPVWDFNLTLGNDLFFWGYDRSKVDTWQFDNGDNIGSKFWKDLFDNSEYKCYLSKRFNELIQPGQAMNINYINAYIDATVALISEAVVRENQKWNTVPNLSQEIINIKSFISNRISWMTNHLGSFTNCTGVYVPPLVITKIHYNPSTTTSFPISADQEFIEISNTGSSLVNLSGIYFKELGISYQFPFNSTISGNSSIFLASNSSVFQTQNGFAPFGQFTRNLSNKSQKLVLSDAFGNIIDNVEYFDSAPWPTAPDGNGSYLQLVSTSLDNNLGSSWIASSNALATDEISTNSWVTIYPNPVVNYLTISSSNQILKIDFFDISGKVVKSLDVNSSQISTDVSALSNGVYFMTIEGEYGIKHSKFIKN